MCPPPLSKNDARTIKQELNTTHLLHYKDAVYGQICLGGRQNFTFSDSGCSVTRMDQRVVLASSAVCMRRLGQEAGETPTPHL